MDTAIPGRKTEMLFLVFVGSDGLSTTLMSSAFTAPSLSSLLRPCCRRSSASRSASAALSRRWPGSMSRVDGMNRRTFVDPCGSQRTERKRLPRRLCTFCGTGMRISSPIRSKGGSGWLPARVTSSIRLGPCGSAKPKATAAFGSTFQAGNGSFLAFLGSLGRLITALLLTSGRTCRMRRRNAVSFCKANSGRLSCTVDW
mmetsp:Transcript_1307/g.5583  ORF Transcript_1307/g.5583 Transcript_1307/m.5583 type:complete len:200 (+) Transcript_1307:1426-2025(+)